MESHENGHAVGLLDRPDTWTPNQRNMRLLESLAYTQDRDDCDLNVTLERALLLLRDEMLNGPAPAPAPAVPGKRGGRGGK